LTHNIASRFVQLLACKAKHLQLGMLQARARGFILPCANSCVQLRCASSGTSWP
jgi:hypothetical protein